MQQLVIAEAVLAAVDGFRVSWQETPSVTTTGRKKIPEMIIETYPRRITLEVGCQISVRPLLREDEPLLVAYFQGLPPEDRLHLKEDVAQPQVIENWLIDLDYDTILPIIALDCSGIVGVATLNFNPGGWGRNQAEVRLTTDPDYRLKGLDILLIQNLIYLARSLGLEQLGVEIPSVLDRDHDFFKRAGFAEVAVLKGFVRNMQGQESDLVLMTKVLQPQPASLTVVGDHGLAGLGAPDQELLMATG